MKITAPFCFGLPVGLGISITLPCAALLAALRFVVVRHLSTP